MASDGCFPDIDMPSLWPPSRDVTDPPLGGAARRGFRRNARGTEPPVPSSLSEDELELRRLIDAREYRRVLERLMDLHGSALYRHCHVLLGDAELARDVHQEVFVQAFQGLARFRGASTLRTWLYAIAHHRCLDAMKHRRRYRNRFESRDQLPDVVVPADATTSQGERATLSRALTLCLEALTPNARIAVLQRHHEELSYEEMAAFSGERVDALRVRVFRAMSALRACLGQKGVSP